LAYATSTLLFIGRAGSARLSLPSDAQARPVPTTSSYRADTDDDAGP
jgi:hypothetical protein